jgi:hypothetical protein
MIRFFALGRTATCWASAHCSAAFSSACCSSSWPSSRSSASAPRSALSSGVNRCHRVAHARVVRPRVRRARLGAVSTVTEVGSRWAHRLCAHATVRCKYVGMRSTWSRCTTSRSVRSRGTTACTGSLYPVRRRRRSLPLSKSLSKARSRALVIACCSSSSQLSLAAGRRAMHFGTHGSATSGRPSLRASLYAQSALHQRIVGLRRGAAQSMPSFLR